MRISIVKMETYSMLGLVILVHIFGGKRKLYTITIYGSLLKIKKR